MPLKYQLANPTILRLFFHHQGIWIAEFHGHVFYGVVHDNYLDDLNVKYISDYYELYDIA